jgi:hypothetical protein
MGVIGRVLVSGRSRLGEGDSGVSLGPKGGRELTVEAVLLTVRALFSDPKGTPVGDDGATGGHRGSHGCAARVNDLAVTVNLDSRPDRTLTETPREAPTLSQRERSGGERVRKLRESL